MVSKTKIVLGVGLLLLGGCTQVKQSIGLEKVSADSFSVEPAPQGLEVPPDFGALPQGSQKKKMDVSQKTVSPSKPCLTQAEKEILEKIRQNKGNQ